MAPDSNQQSKTSISDNILDQWIENQTNNFISNLEKNLTEYNLPNATRLLEPFVNDLSRWYIRQSRDRFATGNKQALQTLWQVLVKFSLATAPIIPFITENLWQNLVVNIDSTKAESIHLENYPDIKPFNEKIANDMTLVQQICEQGNMIRKTQSISTRQPLSKLTISTNQKLDLSEKLLEIIKNELNIKKVEIKKSSENLLVNLDTKITPELKSEGSARDLIRSIQNLRREANLNLKDKIKIFAPDWPSKFEKEILKKTLGQSISKSESLKIEKIN